MSKEIIIPWAEKYRPKSISEILMKPEIKEKFLDIIKDGPSKLPNLLMSGPSGVGKTSLAKILATELKMTDMVINASERNGIETIREDIMRFCSSKTIDGSMKLIILEEANGLTYNGQQALKNVIESSYKTTRFIFTTNHPEKIDDALNSRCKRIFFSGSDIKDIKKLIVQILKEENIKVGKEQGENLKKLIKNFYPDIRELLNNLQFFSTSGTLDIDFDEIATNEVYDEIVNMIVDKQLSKIREILRNDRLDYEDLIKKMFNDILNEKGRFKDLGENQRAEMILHCAAFIDKSLNFVIDREINFAEFCVEMMNVMDL